MIKKYYVWVWVKNPYSTEWNDKPEKELRKYRVKEFKKKCVVLFNGKQYPYSQIVSQEELLVKVSKRSRDYSISTDAPTVIEADHFAGASKMIGNACKEVEK